MGGGGDVDGEEEKREWKIEFGLPSGFYYIYISFEHSALMLMIVVLFLEKIVINLCSKSLMFSTL